MTYDFLLNYWLIQIEFYSITTAENELCTSPILNKLGFDIIKEIFE